MIKPPFGTSESPSSGASGGTSSLAPGIGDALESFRQAWSSFALPPGMTPTIDPAEIERRIAELRTVEQWLVLNLGMLRNSIQALELQLTTLAAMRSFGMGAGTRPADARADTQAPAGASADPASIAAGWWDMLHKQFSDIATAAMPAMPRADAQATAARSRPKAGNAAGGGKRPRKAPGRKTTGSGDAARNQPGERRQRKPGGTQS